ncbi:MAG: hypothetical protein ICV83_12870 [Cytophagales bacterium]|nr:hypothetical protein [Cytophagales bacterium]
MNEADVYEAGFVQRREWMLYQVREDHYPFNVVMNHALGFFDHAVFQKVLDLLVEKHEILRTTLGVVDGSLKQFVHQPRHFRVKFRFYDISAKSPADQECFMQEHDTMQRCLPFNFACGPMFRVLVFEKSPAQFSILLVFHHLVIDKTSMDIFMQDAISFYDLAAGASSRITFDNQKQYRHYTAFENELINTPLGDGHAAYWQANLTASLPRLLLVEKPKWDAFYNAHLKTVKEVRKKIFALPFYDERFIGSVIRRYKTYNAGVLKYQYPEKTVELIRAFKRSSNNSLLSLFIASLLISLHELCGQEVLAFDIPASSRINGDYKEVIGWLTAGGACYFDVREKGNLGDFLDYIDEKLFQLSRHCVFPFEIAGHDSAVPVGSLVPVFLTLMQYKNDNPAGDQPGRIFKQDREYGSTNHTLDVYLHEYANAYTIDLIYNNFLLSPAAVEALVLQQERVLRRITAEAISTNHLPLSLC